MENKVCSRCKQSKSLTEFRSAKMAADGLHPWCRPCDSQYARERRDKLPKKPDHRLIFKKPTWTPPRSAAALAYLAGIIDGEGTITYQQGDRRTRRYRVAVIMTSEETIRWLGQWGGVTKALPRRKDAKPHYKPQWIWIVTSYSNVRLVLTAILPFLVTKRETALEALAYIAARPGAAAPCEALDSLILAAPHHASAESPPLDQ